MAGINKVIIVGRLGKDPEIKFLQSGTGICTFSVATSEKWKDKNSGDWKEKTEWHNITAFGKLAEICAEHLSKGSQCFIEGKLQTDKYEKEGQTHYSTKVVANTVQFLDGKNEEKKEPEEDDVPFF